MCTIISAIHYTSKNPIKPQHRALLEPKNERKPHIGTIESENKFPKKFDNLFTNGNPQFFQHQIGYIRFIGS